MLELWLSRFLELTEKIEQVEHCEHFVLFEVEQKQTLLTTLAVPAGSPIKRANTIQNRH